MLDQNVTNAQAPETQAPETKAPVPASRSLLNKLASGKRISHLQLGYLLAKEKASDAEILRAFTASFAKRNMRNAKFVAKRAEIYMRIGRKKLAAELASKRKKSA